MQISSGSVTDHVLESEARRGSASARSWSNDSGRGKVVIVTPKAGLLCLGLFGLSSVPGNLHGSWDIPVDKHSRVIVVGVITTTFSGHHKKCVMGFRFRRGGMICIVQNLSFREASFSFRRFGLG